MERCIHCDKELTKEELEVAFYHNGNYYCEECMDDLVVCEHCGDIIEADETIYVDSEAYCQNCANRCLQYCHDCGEWIKHEDAYYVNSCDWYVCQGCFEGNYCVCESCDDIITIDESCLYNGRCYCEFCYNENCADENIHEYDYKPDMEFYHKDNENRTNTLHIGIELEIQSDTREEREFFVEDVKDNQYVYLKHDGSLCESTGVEIVSMPMTYEYMIDNDVWKDIFYYMKKHSMNDINNCGLHFHLDRNYFSNEDIQNIDYIVNTFSEYFEKNGGREFNRYCEKISKNIDKFGIKCGDRYCACNLENADTIELRFCASTNDYDVFLKRLNMILQLVYIAQHKKFGDFCNIELNPF